MNVMKILVAAGLSVAALGMTTNADARPNRHHGWHNRHHGWHGHRGNRGRHCRTVWRHHHAVRVCR